LTQRAGMPGRRACHLAGGCVGDQAMAHQQPCGGIFVQRADEPAVQQVVAIKGHEKPRNPVSLAALPRQSLQLGDFVMTVDRLRKGKVRDARVEIAGCGAGLRADYGPPAAIGLRDERLKAPRQRLFDDLPVPDLMCAYKRDGECGGRRRVRRGFGCAAQGDRRLLCW